jgi:hypothetical protein
VVPKDFKVDLPRARKSVVGDLPGQGGKRLPGSLDPGGAGLGGEVVEQVVEAVVAELRRQQRPLAEFLVEVLLEEGGELGVLGVVCGSQEGRGRHAE